MRGLLDRIAPPELGGNFRFLLNAALMSNLADGIVLAAGPLLIASQTSSPSLVAAAIVLQMLPWVLVGLFAGVAADRLDRRRLVVVGDVGRAVVLGALAAMVVTDAVNIAAVLVAMFLLGVAETFTDISATALVPTVVERRHLPVANARFVFSNQALNNLVGPPVGAVLFAAGMFVPFAASALLVGLAGLSVAQLVLRTTERKATESAAAELRTAGQWLWSNPPIRTLTLTILMFNLTFGAMFAVQVLYAEQRLGLGETGFGLFLAASAVGGIVGAAMYEWLTARAGLGTLMQIGLVLETLTYLWLALTTTPLIAMGVMFVFGLQASVWGTTAQAVRQALVPLDLQGRIASIYLLAVRGSIVIGGLVGGAIGSAFGLVAVYWYGLIGSAVFLAAIWRQLPSIVLSADFDQDGVAVDR